ncbi:MAG: hypothetical protein EOM23_05370 [Candidatus Moranbacteria bacterium]|nr:hypothetical protein [Candidatus Moranbacteria bacterium]
MNYLLQISQRIDIALNGYKTPQSVIEKITKGEQRQYRTQNYTSIRKSLYINPPFNGKEKRSNRI